MHTHNTDTGKEGATRRVVAVPTSIPMVTLVGPNDAFLKRLEDALDADILVRGNEIHLTGHPADLADAGDILSEMITIIRTGQGLSADDVDRIVAMTRNGEGPAEIMTVDILSNRGKTVRPKTLNQKRYVDAIDANTVTFGIGPAGTGKTYLAMAKAVQALQTKQVSRIILTRPAVEAGENIGYLPGTLSEKIDPYLRPLYDALRDMVDPDTVPRLIDAGTVEVAPLAYMRGRTLNDAFVILDEAQNTSPQQMKMFLTRLGFGSKIVVTGDVTQVDLPGGMKSGLRVVSRTDRSAVTRQEWIVLAIAFIFTVLASLNVAMETALQHMSHTKAEELAADGKTAHQRVLDMVADPAPFINTAMLVRIISEVTATALVALLIFGHFDLPWQQVLVVVAIMVLVDFLAWGVAPRTLGRQHDTAICTFWSRPWGVLAHVLGPIAALLILIGNALTPGKGYADGPFTSEAELREMVDYAEASDLIEAGEREMIHSVFELGDTLTKEVMVPRTDVVYVPRTKNLRQAMSLALRSGFSRVPVVGEGFDDIRGIVYLKDLSQRVLDNPDGYATESVESIMRPAAFCPDSKPVDQVLREMQRDRNHLVIVVDEFGGAAGLVTIEDIVEEIVGEIVDEYDAEPTLTEEIEDGVFRISSRLPVDDLGELFALKVDDDDVETVGGLMAKELSVVPIPGSVIIWEGLEITAEKATGRRHQVDTCLVKRAPEETPDQEDDDE